MAGNNGVIDTSIHARGVYNETRQVPSAALDNLLSPVFQSIALKIDVEGHEHSVSEGCRNILTKNKCIVQIEIYQRERTKYLIFFELLTIKTLLQLGRITIFQTMIFSFPLIRC
jgi:hypothetical protein